MSMIFKSCARNRKVAKPWFAFKDNVYVFALPEPKHYNIFAFVLSDFTKNYHSCIIVKSHQNDCTSIAKKKP